MTKTTVLDHIHACLDPHATSAACALAVQDFYGGTILRCPLVKGGVYYYNLLPNGEFVDVVDRRGIDEPVKAESRERDRAVLLLDPVTARAYGDLLVRVVNRMAYGDTNG